MPRHARIKRPQSRLGDAWLREIEPAMPHAWVGWCLWAALAAVVLLVLAIHHV